MSDRVRNFASDNGAGICPEAWDYLQQANSGHRPSYGDDEWTQQACEAFRELFEMPCDVFFVLTGTAANSLSLSAACRSYHSVICHELAHLETDECGAPEFYSGGSKILTVPGPLGKVQRNEAERLVKRRKDLHYPKPKVVSVTQATEVGTVYRLDELRELGALTHGLGLHLHMDGARFANAVATLGCAPAELTWRCGVDVLCFGGTKNGLPIGEAVVFFNKQLATEFEYRCKQAGQLASKMRFIAAPWLGMLRDGAWLRHAAHANAMATRLRAGFSGVAGVQVLFPTEANSVFVRLGDRMMSGLRARGWRFYDFIGAGDCRFMCAWDTREEDVDALIADVLEVAGKPEVLRSGANR